MFNVSRASSGALLTASAVLHSTVPAETASRTDRRRCSASAALRVISRKSVTSWNDTTTTSGVPSRSWSMGVALTRYQRVGSPGGVTP